MPSKSVVYQCFLLTNRAFHLKLNYFWESYANIRSLVGVIPAVYICFTSYKIISRHMFVGVLWVRPHKYNLMKEVKYMNINKIRSFLYKTSKYLGDVNAVQKGTIGKRIMRRAAGKASGKLMKKIFK